MSRATAAARPAARSAASRPTPAAQRGVPARRPEVGRLDTPNALRRFLDGTPGRMRLLGLVGALAAAVFGIVGGSALWSSAGALDRADHNTQQVVRVQQIYADLVRADADATSAFLVGGVEDATQRTDYDDSIARVATGITEAAEAQPADGDALGVLNEKVEDYASDVEQARVYNRQGLPVGAQYLSNASTTLRTDILPVVSALVAANTQRAQDEFTASGRVTVILPVGVVGLGVLAFVMVWLARRTHRYLNVPMAIGTGLVLVALLLGLVTLGGVGNRVRDVSNGDFARTVALATMRSDAYDAKSNESLTLIYRGSGATYEDKWRKASADLLTTNNRLDREQQNTLRLNWNDYVGGHQAIRTLDDGGGWDQAVAAARSTAQGSAVATFQTFDATSQKLLDAEKAATSDALSAPTGWVTGLGWLLLALCAVAALLVLRGMNQRLEEYR